MPVAKKPVVEKQIVWTTLLVNDAIDKIQDGYVLKRVNNPFFDGVLGLRRSALAFSMTPEEIQEYIKCKLDIIYFAEKYCFVKGEDGQPTKIEVRDYQEDILNNFQNYRFNILMASRQSGKSICSALTILHFVLFNNNKNVLVTANQLDTATEILDKIREIYQRLPFFLQQGIKNWNLKTILLENKSRIKGFATTKTSSIGQTGDMLYLDEFAYIPENIAQKFYKSVFPTISNIENSRIIITSTPNGINLFHRLLEAAEKPDGDPLKSNYKAKRVYWWEVPKRFVTYIRLDSNLMLEYGITKEEVITYLSNKYPKNNNELKFNNELKKDVIHIYNDENCGYEDILRDEINSVRFISFAEVTSWKEEAIKDIGGEEAFNQEYDLRFINSSNSLFDEKLIDELVKGKKDYVYESIVEFDRKLRWSYKNLKWVDNPDVLLPVARKTYDVIISVDIAEGLGQDYSVLNIFRVIPKSMEKIDAQYQGYNNTSDFFSITQIGLFRSNVVSVKQLAELLYLIAFEYFNSDRVKIVLELNTYGSELLAHMPQVFDGNNNYGSSVFVRYKHRADASEEKIGLKINDNKNLLVKDYQDAMQRGDIQVTNIENIHEITTFVKTITTAGNVRYQSDAGNDDCVMTLVSIATIFKKVFFRDLCEQLVSNSINRELSLFIKQRLNNIDYSEGTDYSVMASVNRNRKFMNQYKNQQSGNNIDIFGKSGFNHF